MSCRFILFIFFLLLGQSAAYSAQKQTLRQLLQEGADALLRGRYDQAITSYNRALRADGLSDIKRANIYSDRGLAKWRLTRHKDAIGDFNSAIELHPEYVAAYNNRGNVLIELGYVDEAINDFNQAISLLPTYGAAYNNRANAHLISGNQEKAFGDYRKAIQFISTSAIPFNGRGKVHLAANRYFSAQRDFTHAIRLSTQYMEAYVNRAKASFGQKKYMAVIGDLGIAIKNKPESAELYALRGQAYKAKKKNKTAIKDFSKAIELDASESASFAERGEVYSRLGEYSNALGDLSQAIELKEDYAAAYASRALVYLQMGDPQNGLFDASKAIQLERGSTRAYWIRAQIHEAEGRDQQAEDDYQKSFQLNPDFFQDKKKIKQLTDEPRPATEKSVGKPFEGWQIKSKAEGRYLAVHEKYHRITVPLEMFGDQPPQLLEWTFLKYNFKGLGMLRYFAGVTKIPENMRIENIAIIDLYKNKVVAIEPFRWGNDKANWKWGDGSVTVTDPDGIAHKIWLRKPRYEEEQRWWARAPGEEGYRGNTQESRAKLTRKRKAKKKPKSFFDFLFP